MIIKKILSTILLFCCVSADAQVPRRIPQTINPSGNGNRNTNSPNASKDTIGFQQRNDLKDSITISYHFLDSTRKLYIDSSVNDFDRYFPVPSNYIYLGNNGAAAYPIIFQPNLSTGWDPGFHAYDLYRFTIDGTKIYRTTRPFSSLSYQLASGKEQMIKATHTQNPNANINFGFDYRLITAPGLFITQNTNHNNYRFFGNFLTKRKRYNVTFVMLGNTIRASENGGIVADSFLRDPNRKDRFSVPVNLGNASQFQTNPFVTTVNTGNTYKDFNLMIRHYFDVGQRDSIAVNDSTTEFLFYPRLRFQHTFQTSSRNFRFGDIYADSAIYKKWYDFSFAGPSDTVNVFEKWSTMSNDISIISFPDAKNIAQFISAGATWQNINGRFTNGTDKFYNLIVHGEYRNRTRNKQWDMELKGEFYLNGLNAGDYLAHAKLSRFLNKRFGNITVFFDNVNRTPSFIFDNRSSFNLGNNNSFKKENIISFGANSNNSWLTLGFRNVIFTNYSYFTDFYHTAQYAKLINLLQINGATKLKLKKHFNWYIEAAVQQVDLSSPIRVPLLYTRHRFAFEGVYFKNLLLSTGMEMRFYSPFKANKYSPLTGQFFPQDSVTIRNRPDINAFFHFRIKTFTGYIRTENLNTVSFSDGFGFTKNNFAAPNYPTQGLIIRFGIQWWFVN